MEDKIIDLTKTLKEKFKEYNLKISDESALDCAIRIIISKDISEQKKGNVSPVNPVKSNLMTEKQRNFIIKNNIPFVEGLSIKEAGQIIKEFIESRPIKPQDNPYD